MQPDARKHNPDPVYLRQLIAASGLNQREVSEALGLSARAIRMYLADRSASTAQPAPYPVQFALEALAQSRSKTD